MNDKDFYENDRDSIRYEGRRVHHEEGFFERNCDEAWEQVKETFSHPGRLFAKVLLIALLASVGTMGVPGAALIMLSMIFTHVGIPLEAIALVAGIDRVMDMARTTINVLGDATAAIFISRTENDFDPQRGAALQDE